MSNKSKVIYLEKSQPKYAAVVKPGEYSELAGTCRGIFFETLEAAVRELFVQVDDDLYRLAENAVDNVRQTLFFDAMRELRLHQKRIEPAFLQAMEDAFQAFWNGHDIPTSQKEEDPDEGKFALVEKDELEEQLAISSMVNKANNACHRELVALNIRFGHMLGRGDLTNEANPVAPAMLAHAFRDALESWDGEVLARIVVYKCFDRVVMSKMKGCYEAINDYLAEQGLMPDLRQGLPLPPSAPAADSRRRPGGQVAAPAATPRASAPLPAAGRPSGQGPTLAQIWGLLQRLGVVSNLGAQGGGGGASAGRVVPRQQVVQALDRLQADAVSDKELLTMDFSLQQEFIRQQLAEQLVKQPAGGQGSVERVGDLEQQTIDVIMALFNQVLDDPNLPDPMRALLGRLQIPVLKAAIADPGFLDNPDHPARALLDELAGACMGWVDDGDRSDKSLYTQVKRAVDRIVHEYRDDLALFEVVREDFAGFVARRKRAQKLLEQRLAQSVAGEEQLTVARMKTDELLEELQLDRLPEPAREILEGPWKKLLTILWLREGDDGKNWQQAVEIARKVSGHLRSPQLQRQRLLAEIPEILNDLKVGFAYISLDQKKSVALLNRLHACFITAMRNRQAQSDSQESSSQDPAEKAEPESSQRPDAPPSPPQDECDRIVAGITEGDWIRLAREEQAQSITCKLVWRSKYTGTMVFVDGQGNKVAQLKDEELAEHFRKGRAELLEDAQAPLIDRALHRMLKMFSAQAGKGAS